MLPVQLQTINHAIFEFVHKTPKLMNETVHNNITSIINYVRLYFFLAAHHCLELQIHFISCNSVIMYIVCLVAIVNDMQFKFFSNLHCFIYETTTHLVSYVTL